MLAPKKIAVYYQTFQPGNKQPAELLSLSPFVTDVLISALHFGYDPVNKHPYVHLNDHAPIMFTGLMHAIRSLPASVKVHLMLGGAGGGILPLAREFEDLNGPPPTVFYPMLAHLLSGAFPRVAGLNIDVEEELQELAVERLVCRLAHDFPDLELSMAPVVGELLRPQVQPDMFSHSIFLRSDASKFVNKLYLQAYAPSAFAESTLRDVLAKKYPRVTAGHLLIGMLAGQEPTEKAAKSAHDMARSLPNWSGVFLWELYGSDPGWPAAMAKAIALKPTTPAIQKYCTIF